MKIWMEVEAIRRRQSIFMNQLCVRPLKKHLRLPIEHVCLF